MAATIAAPIIRAETSNVMACMNGWASHTIPT
jgi:hypothetical protein